MCAFFSSFLSAWEQGGAMSRRRNGKKKERKKGTKNKERRGWLGGRKAVRKGQHRTSRRSLGNGERQIKKVWGAMKRYLFWRPPSPPRSSEKFLQFHQHRLKKKKNSQRKRTQPHYHRVEKKKSERATEREVEGCGWGGRVWRGCGGGW